MNFTWIIKKFHNCHHTTGFNENFPFLPFFSQSLSSNFNLGSEEHYLGFRVSYKILQFTQILNFLKESMLILQWFLRAKIVFVWISFITEVLRRWVIHGNCEVPGRSIRSKNFKTLFLSRYKKILPWGNSNGSRGIKSFCILEGATDTLIEQWLKSLVNLGKT